MNLKEIATIQERLKQLEVERSKLESRLAELQTMCASEEAETQTKGLVTNLSRVSEKIALFRSLFLGREDVFPKRWQNARTGKAGYAPACGNEWISGICGKPKVKCGECPNQDFLRITDEVIDGHLRGRQTIGVYPMLIDGACWFLAADFDKQTWQRDAEAFLTTCRLKQIPSALERSRSGNGGHVWIFFAEPVPVPLARRLGAHLLTETMKRNPDIGFESYDRLFPNQDTMPDGGFGNLIALPLQHGPRQNGNSVFLGELTPEQEASADALLAHDTGVLAATTAFGKAVGRLHRPNPAKREALVYDYVDYAVPMLKRMSEKRLRSYENLGYFVENAGG